MSTDSNNDITNKSAIGIISIFLAILLFITFTVLVGFNLRHWKTQRYKIRVSFTLL